DECGPVPELRWRPRRSAQVLEHLDRLRVPRELGHRDVSVGKHEVGKTVQVEIDPRRTPAGERVAERRRERRPDVVERRSGRNGRLPRVDRMALATRVRDEEVAPPVTVEVGSRDAQPGTGMLGSVYPATNRSGRPSRFTSATAAPVYQP